MCPLAMMGFTFTTNRQKYQPAITHVWWRATQWRKMCMSSPMQSLHHLFCLLSSTCGSIILCTIWLFTPHHISIPMKLSLQSLPWTAISQPHPAYFLVLSSPPCLTNLYIMVGFTLNRKTFPFVLLFNSCNTIFIIIL